MARKSKSADGKKTKPKRIRRKCSAPNCTNRVVQGGVCVTHGAKRKLCSFPDCQKAVKLAGFCSTHGPARRKCDHPGCSRVAVQGGKCLSHGARRRVCCYPLTQKGGEKCTKNAIMGGMCKKHYDRVQDAEGMLEMSLCVPVASSGDALAAAAVPAGVAVASVSGGSASAAEELLSEEESMTLGSSPSWVSMAPPAPTVEEQVAVQVGQPLVPPPPPQAPAATVAIAPRVGGHRRSRSNKLKPGHERGLSIFDEMQTVDAIIGSQATPTAPASNAEAQAQAQAAASQPPAAPTLASRAPQQIRTSATYPPKSVAKSYPPRYPQAQASAPLPAVPSMSTKTPTTTVSFADQAPSSKSTKPGETPCTGNSSCTCNACRSPTLAIFEQMIQASQKLEQVDKYAGLSPPKLSPRKSSVRMGSFTGNDVAETTQPLQTPREAKNVSFLPEEPTSSGSVVRKVSSNNILGEAQAEAEVQVAPSGGIPPYERRASIEARQDYRGHEVPPPQVPQGAEGPASHALAALARDEDGVSRTVSHDVDDGRHQYAAYYPQAAPPQTQPHYAAYYQPQVQAPVPPPPAYEAAYPAQTYAYQAQEPPKQPPREVSRAEFHPPQTPALYDAAERREPTAVVSAHSTHHHDGGYEQAHHGHLLPRRREAIEHLFIPKEV